MKIGRAAWWSDVEVYLPFEVIELILQFVYSHNSKRRRQRILWSCSLVSKLWYSAAVRLLYHAPVLTGKNFTEFARTISPPLSMRERSRGLENLIHHLDMHRLAYETTKSTTARLISRTHQSLETFVAPTVSISISSLAPLSKCSKLELLDLSKASDHSIQLKQLLSSIGDLEHLLDLSLPQSSLHSIADLTSFTKQKTNSSGKIVWPPHLSHLTFNNTFCAFNDTWVAMMSSWPQSLQVLTLANCDLLSSPGGPRAVAEHITTLNIDNYHKRANIHLPDLLVSFPKVRQVFTLAYNLLLWEGPAPQDLEHLIIENWEERDERYDFTPDYMLMMFENCPNLIKIEIPELYIDFDDDTDGVIVGQICRMIESRVKMRADGGEELSKKDYGLWLTDIDYSDELGLRKNTRYAHHINQYVCHSS